MQHAGYAVALSLGQNMVRDLLRVLYNGRLIGPNIQLETPGCSLKMFVRPPRVELTRNGSNQIKVTLEGWGTARVTPPLTGIAETRSIFSRITVLVPPLGSIADGQLKLQFDSSAAILSTFELTPSGGTFTPAAQEFIKSKKILENFQVQVRVALALLNMKIPEIDLSGLGGVSKSPDLKVTTVVLNQALAFGVDVTAGPSATSGKPELLNEFLDGDSIGFWVNPIALTMFFSEVTKNIRKRVEEKDAKLDSISFASSDGFLSVAGTGSATGGTAKFSFDITPTIDPTFLTFAASNIKIDVDRAWWAALLEFATFPMGLLAVEGMVSAITGEIDYNVRAGSGAAAVRRTQVVWLADVKQRVELTLQKFQCHSSGIYLGSTFLPIFWKPSLVELGRKSDPIEVLNEAIRIGVILPPGVHYDDPHVRITWTLRNYDRLSTNFNAILSTASFNGSGIVFNVQLAPLNKIREFAVDCEVRRKMGDSTPLQMSPSLANLRFIGRVADDRLDRSHPFVRWTHALITPTVEITPTGVRRFVGYDRNKVRRSRIHRTDLGGRCRMAARFSKKVPVPEYLDTLPFAVSEAENHRAKLCDYCFFGGPDKSDLLVTWK